MGGAEDKVGGRVSVNCVIAAEGIKSGMVRGDGERRDAEAAMDLVGLGLAGAGDWDGLAFEAVGGTHVPEFHDGAAFRGCDEVVWTGWADEGE